jgi:hypothetical protein
MPCKCQPPPPGPLPTYKFKRFGVSAFPIRNSLWRRFQVWRLHNYYIDGKPPKTLRTCSGRRIGLRLLSIFGSIFGFIFGSIFGSIFEDLLEFYNLKLDTENVMVVTSFNVWIKLLSREKK